MSGNDQPTKRLRSNSEIQAIQLMQNQRVCVLLTGGTAGMKRDENGTLRPVSGFLNEFIHQQLLSRSEDLSKTAPHVTVYEFPTQLDSADMGPEEWKMIGNEIYQRYSEYDGFVVIMGTDTLAFCASALAFMFENLSKPIVVTGAMLPIERSDSDAPRNLMVSITVAAVSHIPEVVVVFDSFVYRGCRTKKVDSLAIHAFDSPNFPPLAKSHGVLSVQRELVRSVAPNTTLSFSPEMSPQVVAIRLIPGFHAQLDLVKHASGIRGLVLELYGAGNAPKSKPLIDAVMSAVSRGVLVVICSQCPKGAVDLFMYENGRQLLNAGAISAADMTFEACVTKLAYLLARNATHLMKVSLRGEQSDAPAHEARFSDWSVVKDVNHLG